LRTPTFLLAGGGSCPTPIPACSVRLHALIVAEWCHGTVVGQGFEAVVRWLKLPGFFLY
jgi:hypothetical protein